MNKKFSNEKIDVSLNDSAQSVQVASNKNVEPINPTHLQLQRKKTKKNVFAVICILLMISLGIAALGDIFYAPSLAALFRGNNHIISHSIENMIKVDKDGYKQEILSAYIKNKQVYVDIFSYRSDTEETVDEQSINPLDDSSQHTEYTVYYKGEKCEKDMQSYGSVNSLSYKMPAVKAQEVIQVSLYMGDEMVSEIELLPTGNNVTTNKEKLPETANRIHLTASVQRRGDQAEVLITAMLPQNADRDNLVNGCQFGFYEQDIYIQDKNGTIYKDKSMDFFDKSVNKYIISKESEKTSTERLILHRSYHVFYFDIPDEINGFEIIIPYISYMSHNNMIIEKYGPWKISVNR